MSYLINLLGNWFNAFIDMCVILSDRYSSLPMVFLLIIAISISAIVYFIIRAISVQSRRHLSLRYGLVLLTLLIFSLLFDIKIHRINRDFLRITQKSFDNPNSLFDLIKVKSGLKDMFGSISISTQQQCSGIEYIFIQISRPHEVKIHVAVIDLRIPGLEICITPEFKKKELTSDFARQNNCIVAINGEAGESPFYDPVALKGVKRIIPNFNPGLGIWSGIWIVKGKAVSLDNKYNRPFIAFDKNNQARYFYEEAKDTTMSLEKYNAIWGRFDAIVEGKISVSIRDMLQPRTCMGLNKDGTKLILMVVDGRRQGYSLGLDPIFTAKVLKLFDAHNAMFCDQGGSACMYLKAKGGIVSVPSDGDGLERPIYCSFGVSIK